MICNATLQHITNRIQRAKEVQTVGNTKEESAILMVFYK